MKKTLRERILKFSTTLNDNTDIYVGEELLHGKGLEKAKKGRKNLAQGSDEEPIAVVDSTVWGSVAEGFYITENFVYAKALYEDRHEFPIQSISSIVLNEKKMFISINGTEIRWLSGSATPKIKILFECIEEHILQPKETPTQEGKIKYIEGLIDSIFRIGFDITAWSMKTSQKAFELSHKNINCDPMSFDDLSFFEKISITSSRSTLLKEYDDLVRQIEAKISSLNNSKIFLDANSIFKSEGMDEMKISFKTDHKPSRITSISNENWSNSYDKAIMELTDCGNKIESQISAIEEKLKEVKKLDEDDE